MSMPPYSLRTSPASSSVGVEQAFVFHHADELAEAFVHCVIR